MISVTDVTTIVADAFFNGSTDLAGLVIFSICLAIMFAISKNGFATLILALPMTFVFSMLGFVQEDMLILLVIVIVLGLAYTGRNVWSR